MEDPMSPSARLKARLAVRDPVLGIFIKTPHPSVVEALADGGLDCICLDAEHAPFDRGTLDAALLAAHYCGIAALVRVPSGSPHEILNALDCGAAGVLVPHVRTPQQAADIARAAAYGPGGRGYAGPMRGNTSPAIAERLSRAQQDTSVIVQIEDIDAVPHAAAIAATPGIDAVFIGRIDLTVAMGETDPKAARVMTAVQGLVATIGAAGCAVGMYTPDNAEIADWRRQGASLFLLGSDHGFLGAGARRLREETGLSA
jgi:2-keto-3-deoxy-L-rhamnonate aldolase RhmA